MIVQLQVKLLVRTLSVPVRGAISSGASAVRTYSGQAQVLT